MSGILGNLTSPLRSWFCFMSETHQTSECERKGWFELYWLIHHSHFLAMFSPLSTLQVETMIWILPMRELEKAPHQWLTPPPATPPSSQKYVPAYYSDTIRGIWGKVRVPSLPHCHLIQGQRSSLQQNLWWYVLIWHSNSRKDVMEF